MSAYPSTKFLTAVVILLFTSLSWGQETTAKYKNKEDCIADQENETANIEKCKKASADKASEGKFNATEVDRCVSQLALKICQPFQSKSDINEAKTKCQSAFEKYSEAQAKSKDACDAFESGSTAAECKVKVSSCGKKIKNLSKPFSMTGGETPEDPDPNSGYAALRDVALTQVYSKMGIANNSNTLSQTGGACVKSIDRKDIAQQKKDKDRERRDLSDKIEQQKKDILKITEELNKEKNENAEEIARLEAENKKDNLSKDKSMREETSKISKDTVNVGTRLRGLSSKITKQMQQLAQVNFTFQSQMLQLTDKKVADRCKQQMTILQAGMVNQKMGQLGGADATPEQKKQLESYAIMAAQFKANGIKGSGELRNMLISARKDCFEQADTERNQKKLANSQAVETLQADIEETKNQMNDEKKNLSLSQENIKKLQEETGKEKNAAESEKLTKLENLSKKLSDQIANTNKKIEVANAKIQELTNEINNAMMTQNFEVESNFSEATNAIEKGDLARTKAIGSCNCATALPTDEICSRLKVDKEKYGGEEPKVKGSTRSKK